MDVERKRFKRLLAKRIDRLGAIREDVEGVEVLSATPESGA